MDFEDFEPLEQDETADDPRDRCTAEELGERQAAAGELLCHGLSTSAASRAVAVRYGVSLRQARRYVRIAALERAGEQDAVEQDLAILLIAENLADDAVAARERGDHKTAIQADKARAAVLTQFRKAIAPVKPQRIRFPTARTKPQLPW
jgi:hypothetical protein